MVELVLGNVYEGDVVLSPVEEMGQDHPVHGSMAHDHDVLGVAAEV
jgi:hypothetical protein